MALDDRTAEAVGYLLRLTDGGTARRVRVRLGLDAERVAAATAGTAADNRFRAELQSAPASVRYWLLRADDPAVNAALYGLGLLPPGLARDVVQGVPFAPVERTFPDTDDRRVPLSPQLRVHPEDPRLGDGFTAAEILALLYRGQGTNGLRRARRAAREIRTAHWPEVARAHREDPLPGFARWALAERIDCPTQLRESFGSHAKFGHRLRAAGIVGELDDVVGHRAAVDALPLLGMVHRVQPRAVADSEAVLRPLVRTELGGNTEAWAVLAQLLPDFVGTVTELVPLAAAIAGPADDPAPADDIPGESPAAPVEPAPAYLTHAEFDAAHLRTLPRRPPPVAQTPVPVVAPAAPPVVPKPFRRVLGAVRGLLAPSSGRHS
ncbi:hypothetical protein GCM10010441_23000 [Kitasatospora paracochleata]|uniref:Uncharacterized protein n=1 Tax=Kitasatospora paracochleata TaxID=58354 RepID=A0ABT1J4X5_9ACTN|nr:hypothetical protein [Kitasatospora paracochleata]MCP2312486.1 hypothetical protein [Kitasatospora paracochleata]